MRAYISLGYYDTREQQLVSSHPVLDYLLGDLAQSVEECGAELVGIIAPHTLRYKPLLDLPILLLPQGGRTVGELRAITQAAGEGHDPSQWVMVMRPAVGKLSSARVKQFHAALKDLSSPLAASAISFESMAHPLWNTMLADRRCHVNGSIRHARKGGSQVAQLQRACPQLWESLRAETQVGGSQHLKTIYQDDRALYAARPGVLDLDAELPEARIVLSRSGSGASDNLLHRLPVFEMSREMAVDLSVLEALLQRGRPGQAG